AAAHCLVELGDLAGSRELLTEARPLLDIDRDPGAAAAWHETSATLHLLAGTLGAAQRDLARVWRICQRFGFAGPILRAATNIAQTRILLNQTVEADAILTHVAAEAERRGD